MWAATSCSATVVASRRRCCAGGVGISISSINNSSGFFATKTLSSSSTGTRTTTNTIQHHFVGQPSQPRLAKINHFVTLQQPRQPACLFSTLFRGSLSTTTTTSLPWRTQLPATTISTFKEESATSRAKSEHSFSCSSSSASSRPFSSAANHATLFWNTTTTKNPITIVAASKYARLDGQPVATNSAALIVKRTYISRAHCHNKPREEYPIPKALEMLLHKAQERKLRRQRRFVKYGACGAQTKVQPQTKEKSDIPVSSASTATTALSDAAAGTADPSTAGTAAAASDSSTSTLGAVSSSPEQTTSEVVSSEAAQGLETAHQEASQTTTTTTKSVVKDTAPVQISHPDETVELAVNLNLDPRKPGQSLRGNITLPHGTGKRISIMVFTSDTELQKAALAAGATHAGGEDLIQHIASGQVTIEGVERSLATADIMPLLSKRVARLLGPRGLMPNAKTGTLWNTTEELLLALQTQQAGKEVLFRTDKAGIIHVPVGKVSFGVEKLLENIGQVMKEIVAVKPETYGKTVKKSANSGGGKKGAKASTKNPKYLLRAAVSSTQGPGFRVDLRTLEPSSAFFLGTVVDAGAATGRGKSDSATATTTSDNDTMSSSLSTGKTMEM